MRPSRQDIWCAFLTLAFAAPPLFSFVRHPRPLFLLFVATLAATAFRPIQLILRAGAVRYIYAYLGLLYLLLSPGLITAAGPAEGIRYYTFYYCFTLVVIAVLSQSGRYFWLAKIPTFIAAVVALGVALAYLTYAIRNHAMLTEEALNAVYQTDLHEAVGYVRTFVGILPLAFSLPLLLLTAFLLIRSSRLPAGSLARWEFGTLLTITLLLAWETRDASSEYLVASSALRYHTSVQRYRQAAALRRAKLGEIEAKLTRKEPETHVIVIGESANRNHMRLYGYFRDTTPNLGRLARDLVVLTDAISCDRFTEMVLDKALTVADVDNQLSFGDPSAYSLIDVLHAAGIRTYWLSNQNRMGLWDNHTSLLAEGADRRLFVSGFIGERTYSGPDEAVFPAFRKALDDAAGAKVIFVHLMGAHFPYSLRYPAQFSFYRGSIPSEEMGRSEVNEKATAATNEYDNAVRYNDYVVATLIEELRRRGGSASLLYLSDHGDSPLGIGRDQRFIPAHVEIPMLFWFSDKFHARHSALIEALTANSRNRFMNDDMFHTALDLVGVDTKIYSPQRSLFRREYVQRNRMTLSGKLDYDGYPDGLIQARNNIAKVVDKFPRLAQKVYVWSGPTRGSLGQAIDVFPRVALDLVFDEPRGTFDLAHSVPGIGLTLEAALEFLRSNGSEPRLLLRLGNIRESNAAQAAAIVVNLDEKYHFRERTTLVTASGPLRSLVQLGFTTALTAPEGPSVASARAAGTAGDPRSPIVTVASGAAQGARENSGRTATVVKLSDAVVVECEVDPSDGAFVNSMSKLSEADSRKTIAIVLREPSRFDEHF